MSSGVYLGGGGSATDEVAVWDEMLIGVRSLLYWPVALSGSMLAGADTWLDNSLSGRSNVRVTSWHDLSQHRGEGLADFDLIFVGGGNTFDLQDRIRRAGLEPSLRSFLANGGTYYGGSAGAVVAGENIGIASGLDEDSVGSPDRSGLRLIPGADLLPHFTPSWIDHAVTWSARHPDHLIIGIPEAGGIRCDMDDPSGRVSVIGPDPVRLFIAGEATALVVAGAEFTLPRVEKR